MLLEVKLRQTFAGIEGKLVAAALHHILALLGEGNGCAIHSVESEGVVLAEMIPQKLFGDFFLHW